jgi:hypothetical protein
MISPATTFHSRPTKQEELLLQAALLQGDRAIQAWEEWISSVDIDQLDRSSRKLLPLLYHNLHLIGITHPSMVFLKSVKRYTWYKNQILFVFLERQLQEFRKAGIKTMLLKGDAMTAVYYKDYSLRPMEDLDIMVPYEQASKAIAVLRESDWKSVSVISNKLISKLIKYKHAEHFKLGSDTYLDLHWHLLPHCLEPNADEDYWNNACQVTVGTENSWTLNPTDQLLHICAHGLVWEQPHTIRWTADAMTVIRQSDEIDWERLIVQVQKHRITKLVRYALLYLKENFDAPVPSYFLDMLADTYISKHELREFRVFTNPQGFTGRLPLYLCHFNRAMQGTHWWSKVAALPSYFQIVWHNANLKQIPFIVLRKTAHRMTINFDKLISFVRRKDS